MGSLRGGGHGIIATEVLGSNTTPELRDVVGASGADLEALVKDGLARKAIALEPDPASLVGGLQVSGLRDLVEAPRLTEPWLWDTGDMFLVYGVVFERKRGAG